MSRYKGIKQLAINALVKNGVIKPLDAIDLSEDKEIVVYAPPQRKRGEDGSSFFFPSAFEFWKDKREDLYYGYL